ncbi:cobyric acid synthase [Paenibacillus sp. GSMTC-2017]|uniref:cobyric acid synthase n=1 Tax=Paenibacillus sp. GSMTC-2017 TaxID=2794350 RepID=UPI0018D75649|nr:cobyric acid synthase [Paenibacillus sp. GSMTC-2017]MBH5316493.1 cobyric acid synthase [Paenibacillus sp. GSMTC-2017]
MLADDKRITDHQIGRTIMIQGTASDVGKSLVTAALCRIFTGDGWKTAPFKSQNMSLNSYVTWDGKEIGRAQGMQADACGILATTDMNPILLKPTKEMSSQVVVHGVPLKEFEAREYREEYLPIAGGIVRESLGRLRQDFDIVVLEGAGSPAEINLKDRDIVNMRMAAWADAPVILVADIDRGGVFASIVGTLELLEPEERDRIRGFIINKFRGDVSLLKPGLDWLEERTGKPVFGVLPYLNGLELEDEDSLSLHHLNVNVQSGRDVVEIAVIRFPLISNFTDVDPLRFEQDVQLRFIDQPQQWGNPDVVILPGSKNTIADLLWVREQGLADLILNHIARGGAVVGLCGGYEMLGEKLLDPLGVESNQQESGGLNLFPFEVEFLQTKRTVRVEGFTELYSSGEETYIEGYEIHMGVVRHLITKPLQPFNIRKKSVQGAEVGGSDYEAEGVMTDDGRVWGTFIHGILHNDDFRLNWLNDVRKLKGLPPLHADLRFNERREAAFDTLAEHVRKHVNLPLIYETLGV